MRGIELRDGHIANHRIERGERIAPLLPVLGVLPPRLVRRKVFIHSGREIRCYRIVYRRWRRDRHTRAPLGERINAARDEAARLGVQRAGLGESDIVSRAKRHAPRPSLRLIAVVPVTTLRRIDDEPEAVAVRVFARRAREPDRVLRQSIAEPISDPGTGLELASRYAFSRFRIRPDRHVRPS